MRIGAGWKYRCETHVLILDVVLGMRLRYRIDIAVCLWDTCTKSRWPSPYETGVLLKYSLKYQISGLLLVNHRFVHLMFAFCLCSWFVPALFTICSPLFWVCSCFVHKGLGVGASAIPPYTGIVYKPHIFYPKLPCPTCLIRAYTQYIQKPPMARSTYLIRTIGKISGPSRLA